MNFTSFLHKFSKEYKNVDDIYLGKSIPYNKVFYNIKMEIIKFVVHSFIEIDKDFFVKNFSIIYLLFKKVLKNSDSKEYVLKLNVSPIKLIPFIKKIVKIINGIGLKRVNLNIKPYNSEFLRLKKLSLYKILQIPDNIEKKTLKNEYEVNILKHVKTFKIFKVNELSEIDKVLLRYFLICNYLNIPNLTIFFLLFLIEYLKITDSYEIICKKMDKRVFKKQKRLLFPVLFLIAEKNQIFKEKTIVIKIDKGYSPKKIIYPF